MYQIYDDSGDVTITAEDKEQALEQYLDDTDAQLYEVQFSPEILTAQMHTDKPFSLLDHDEQVTWLSELLGEHVPYGAIARETVLAELEHIYRVGPDNTPDDVHPTEGDHWEEMLNTWIADHVAVDRFSQDVWVDVREILIDRCYNEICGRWDDVTDRIGNPARARTTSIQDEIERLED
jgi:hypothetical protein